MARLLFTVEDAFEIKRHGVVLSPGLSRNAGASVGDAIRLKRLDGVVTESTISGIALAGVNAVGIDILLKNVAKDDVPIGTEVWSVDEPEIA